jgi:hypothetical protein
VKIEEIRQQNLPPEKWNPDQLKAMLKWYKRDGDSTLLKHKQEQLDLITRFVAMKIFCHCHYLIQMRKWIFHHCNCLIQTCRRRIQFLHCLF